MENIGCAALAKAPSVGTEGTALAPPKAPFFQYEKKIMLEKGVRSNV